MALDDKTDERSPTFERTARAAASDGIDREDLLVVLAGVVITAGILYDMFWRRARSMDRAP